MSRTRTTPVVASLIGLILSAYSLYVEYKVSHPQVDEEGGEAEEFVALCDIEAIGASCSTVFQMPEGRLVSYLGIVPSGHTLDVPNPVLGLLFYGVTLLNEVPVPIFFPLKFIVFATVGAMSASTFLAYKLIVLKELCIVCWTIHVINVVLLMWYGRKCVVGTCGSTVRGANKTKGI